MYRRWLSEVWAAGRCEVAGITTTGQEMFRAENGLFVEVWHQEDLPTMLAQLGLQPPPPIMRLAARASAWRYRREDGRER